VMTRKMLLTLKQRAEQTHAQPMIQTAA